MKMVSAAKYARAEKDLKAARPYGNGAQAFYTSAEVGSEAAEKTLYVAMTSDRGLCGGVHSSICKTIRNELLQKSEGELANVGIICVGDKARAQLSRLFPKQVLAVGSEIAKVELSHIDVSQNMEHWPAFHNGVAAGLRLSAQRSSQNIDSTWICFNKPKNGEAQAQTEHAGFL